MVLPHCQFPAEGPLALRHVELLRPDFPPLDQLWVQAHLGIATGAGEPWNLSFVDPRMPKDKAYSSSLALSAHARIGQGKMAAVALSQGLLEPPFVGSA